MRAFQIILAGTIRSLKIFKYPVLLSLSLYVDSVCDGGGISSSKKNWMTSWHWHNYNRRSETDTVCVCKSEPKSSLQKNLQTLKVTFINFALRQAVSA